MKGISIVIPTLHRTEFLLNTLKDLVKQVCDFPFEIVIVDQSNQLDDRVVDFCKNYTFFHYHHIINKQRFFYQLEYHFLKYQKLSEQEVFVYKKK